MQFQISREDRLFIDRLRGLSIIRVVLVHLGLSWFFPPYSQFVLVFLPILFFVSGAASYNMYLKAGSTRDFGLRRIIGIYLPYALIAFTAISIYTVAYYPTYRLETSSLIKWLTINPSSDDMPYPMGQIWFLRALIVIIFMSLVIFPLTKYNPHTLLAPVLLSIALGAAQSFTSIHNYFIVNGFNLYQPLVNAGFFFLGAYIFHFDKLPVKALAISSGALLISGFIFRSIFSIELDVSESSYAPNIYYLTLANSAIFLTLSLKSFIQYILDRARLLDSIALAYSKHAYSVFMTHSLMIYATEILFGWENVMEQPIIALLKIIFVMLSSLFISVPVTWMTQKLVRKLTTSWSLTAA